MTSSNDWVAMTIIIIIIFIYIIIIIYIIKIIYIIIIILIIKICILLLYNHYYYHSRQYGILSLSPLIFYVHLVKSFQRSSQFPEPAVMFWALIHWLVKRR